MKKISIITINFNNLLGLKKTIESVINQTFKEFEYIIIDGGSLDGSKELLTSFTKELDFWVSEADNGIYNAMNKGIKYSSGEYLLFLNSGDILIDKTILEKISVDLNGESIIYGDGQLELSSGIRKSFYVPEFLTLDYFSENSLFHPSTFIKKDLFVEFGLYDETLKIVGDWEFFLKVVMVKNVIAKKVRYPISVIEDGGISRDFKNRDLINIEINVVLRKYFPDSVLVLLENFKKLKQSKSKKIKDSKNFLSIFFKK